MKTYAIILAGGVGCRMGNMIHKCDIKLNNGKTILEQTLSVFDNCDFIDKIIIVSNDYICANSKNYIVVNGGATRGQSILNGMSAIVDNDANIIIHDGCRPFVCPDILLNGLHKLNQFDIIKTVAESPYDIMLKDKCGIITRNEYVATSSPDFTTLTFLQKLDRKILCDVQCITICALKQIPDVKIDTIISNRENIKITYPEDLILANYYLDNKGGKNNETKI